MLLCIIRASWGRWGPFRLELPLRAPLVPAAVPAGTELAAEAPGIDAVEPGIVAVVAASAVWQQCLYHHCQ